MKHEKRADTLVIDLLRMNHYIDENFTPLEKNVFIWSNRPENKVIDELISKSSQKGIKNQIYPEFIIFDKKLNLVIVIEDKHDTRYHIHAKMMKDKATDYAVNGALWYAFFLKETFDVIAIGISGDSVDNLRIDTYAWKKEAEIFTNLNEKNFLEISKYRDIMKKQNRNVRSICELKTLTAKAKDINDFLRNYMGVIENKRLYVVGSILYALENPTFKMAYSAYKSNSELASFLYQTIERKIKNSSLKNIQIIQDELKPALEGLGRLEKEGVRLEYPNGTLLELINTVDRLLFDYYKNSELDLISIFFNVFLSYSTSGGSDLGIVLTPSHIAKLFTCMADINLNSKILDPCAGTGGFLTSSWKRISLNPNYTFTEKDTFRRHHLCGVEKDPSIYTIIALNMFLNKDDRSMIYNSDCFSLKEELMAQKCNVGFINPPYSDEVYPELGFVELMLDCLLPNSIGIAVIPVNAVSGRTKKHARLEDIKKRILQKHTLIASIQLPTQLFYPKCIETIILAFETGRSHEGRTWFAMFEDGYQLIKQQGVRTPTKESEHKFKELLEAYRAKTVTAFSYNKTVSYTDQWVYMLYKPNDYSFGDLELQTSLNDYAAYLLHNRYKLKSSEMKVGRIPNINLTKVNLVDFFDILPTKQKDKINVHVLECHDKKAIPFLGRKAMNNGISDYIEKDPHCLNRGGVLTVALDGSTGATFYQHHDFASGQNIWILSPKRNKIREFTPEIALYLATSISQAVRGYSYNLSLTKTRLEKIEIFLPLHEDQTVNIQYIKKRMSHFENVNYIQEISEYRY